MDTPGVTTLRYNDLGSKAIGRSSIFFDDVVIPSQNRLADEGAGFVQVMQGFDFSRALIGLQVLGSAQASLEETWDYVAQREAFGKPLSAFQGVSHPLADFDTQVEAARLLCLHTLGLKDKGAPHTAEAAMCKWWAPKLAYDVIHQCLLMFGHGGYDRGVDGAAAARRARLPDRRRHGADHENHHRAHPRRPRRRAGLTASQRNRRRQAMEFDAVLLPPRRAAWSRRASGTTAPSTTTSTPASRRCPDKLALTAVAGGSGCVTTLHLPRARAAMADRIAVGLSRLGVGRNDVVACQLPNWWQFTLTYLACSRIGAVMNPLMHIFRERELSFMLEARRSQGRDRAEDLPRLRLRADGEGCSRACPT